MITLLSSTQPFAWDSTSYVQWRTRAKQNTAHATAQQQRQQKNNGIWMTCAIYTYIKLNAVKNAGWTSRKDSWSASNSSNRLIHECSISAHNVVSHNNGCNTSWKHNHTQTQQDIDWLVTQRTKELHTLSPSNKTLNKMATYLKADNTLKTDIEEHQKQADPQQQKG